MSFKPFIVFLILLTMNVIAFSQQIQLIKEGWQFTESGKTDWHKAQVPGCIHTDLLNNGLINDPFYRTNERDLQWIDKKNWTYQTTFEVNTEIRDQKHIELVLKGLDTYANVYLNESLIISADNMFRQWSVDVTNLLKQKTNVLRIEFESAIERHVKDWDALGFEYPAVNDQSENGGVGNKKLSVFARKAGYHYGWDWGPRFVTSGIWREIYLQAWDKCEAIDNTIIQKEVTTQRALVCVQSEIVTERPTEVQQKVFINGILHQTKGFTTKGGTEIISSELEIASPRLWWCNGLGDAYLYDFTTEISVGEQIVSRSDKKVGIRSLRHFCNKDEHGRAFYFELNGVPVFMKGANYIPIDNFVTRVDAQRYEEVVKSAADANMNMLRVWGGGIYENDIFYDLCDKYGILVWQDFMFACSLYPSDNKFLDNVKKEAIDNVKRLRSHASIALWCGNNEIHTAWYTWGWKEKFEKQSNELAKQLWNGYDTLFNKLLASVVAEYAPETAYWPSSPMASASGDVANNFSNGDVHYWEVWHAEKPYEDYLTHVGRFMSEYGFQSFPELSTVEKYTIKEDRDIESDVMLAHQRHPRGNQLIKKYLSYYYKTPKDFESFLYVGQVLQAEGIRMAIEAHRRAMPYCMGSLYWQLNDCWPVASWSSTDYFGRWKAEHFFNKKAYQNILVSTTIEDGRLKLHSISDHLKDKEVVLAMQVLRMNGEIVWQKQKQAKLQANASAIQFEAKITDLLQNTPPEEVIFFCKVLENGSEIARNLHYFVPVKDLKLEKAAITYDIDKQDIDTILRIKTNRLAKNVYIRVDGKEVLDDNYFDLLPGEIKDVCIKHLTEGAEIKIISLIDSY